jgi:hypothetical protein
MRRVPSHIASRKIYNKAIGLLREQISRSRFIKFGIWSDGFIPIAGKPGEYQSNSLSIEDGVVVSWPKSL